ncbi:MAG: hypothetical protein FJ126_08490 [Deltaproteobacteria bacterium]|nr:hypothetical protein [Deltaproteobacteria bacterium]
MRALTCIAWLLLGISMTGAVGCVTPRPAALPGVTLQPGRFLESFYRDPEFVPERSNYVLESFNVELAVDMASETFQAMLREEMGRAWDANGLKLGAAEDACRVSGTVHHVEVGGSRIRFLMGKIHADLSISGVITRGEKTLFAFQDRIHLTTPVRPGRAAPKEGELLVRRAVQEFAAHLLNEILLQGLPPAEG